MRANSPLNSILTANTGWEWPRLAAGILLCGWLFLWLGQMTHVPADAGYNGSLLLGGPVVSGFLLAAVLLAASAIIGAVIAGPLDVDSGLFVACAAMGALSLRAGTMKYVLFAARGPAIFLALAAEVVALFALVALAWEILQRVFGNVFRDAKSQAGRTENGADATDTAAESKAQAEPLNEKLLTTAAQVAGTAIVLSFVAQTDAKAQVLAGVFIASAVGSIVARYVSPTRSTFWYFIAPGIVAVVGYVITFTTPDGWNIGVLQGAFAPLARPLPLDYAAAGPAGALFGYWTAKSWQMAESDDE